MHVQIVTYGLQGMTEGEYIDIAARLAPRFAALPGLLAKVWLESPEEGVYGAVYLWQDREAMDRFLASDLFEGTNPDFVDLGSDDFSVLENLTRATQPALTVLEDPAPRGRAPARALTPRKGPPAVARPTRAVKAAPSAPAGKASRAAPPAPARVTKVSPVAPAAKAAPTDKAAKAKSPAKVTKAPRPRPPAG